MKSRNFEF
jgi:hypothetical protein